MSLVGRSFLHASDIHLGFPLGALRDSEQLDANDLLALIEQMQQAFDNLIKLAINEQVMFVVLAGDIYDDLDKQDALQGRFRRGLEELAKHNIGVFMIHGNHDPLTSAVSWRRPLPSNCHVFQPNEPQEFLAASSADDEVWVAGVSFGSKKVAENLAQRFLSLPAERAKRRVGVLHTSLNGNPNHEAYAPCTIDDLRAAPVGYWALGHVHLRDDHNPLGPGRWWAYSGNLQGKSFKPAECQPKGALLVRLSPDGFDAPKFCELDTVRFVNLKVAVDEIDDVNGALSRIMAGLDQSRNQNGDRRLVVRVELTGRSQFHSQLHNLAASGKLRGNLIDEYRNDLGDTIIAAVASSVLPEYNPADLRRGDSLIAVALARIDAMSDEEVIEAAASLIGDNAASDVRTNPEAASFIRARVELALVEAILDAEGVSS